MNAYRFLSFPLLAVALVGCQTQPEQPLNSQYGNAATFIEGVPGGSASETEELFATVASINPSKRSFVLKDEQGNRRTIQAPAQMQNFDQLKVGDQVHAMAVVERIVYLRAPNEVAMDGASGLRASAPLGDKPGLLASNVLETSAKVKAMDSVKRTATLEFADGSQRTVKVRPDVEMKNEYLGQEVVLRMTSALAISVEPQQ